jgi:hypothetical protein
MITKLLPVRALSEECPVIYGKMGFQDIPWYISDRTSLRIAGEESIWNKPDRMNYIVPGTS